jgi:multiple sugar transport system substrate-binding protein
MQENFPLEKVASGSRLTRKKFVAGAAGAAVIVGSGSAGAAVRRTKATVDLQFWNGFTGGDGPFMLKLVKQFNKEHPGVNVKMVVQQWADYYQKVPQAVASGRGPDVGVMHVDTLATNAARNVILPLDDVAKQLNLQADDFASIIWNAGMYQGKRYGIPLDTHPLGFYYNKAHLRKAGVTTVPQTKAQLDDAMQKLQKAGIKNPFWQSSTWPAHLMFMSLLWQFGGDLYNEDATQATFNSKAGVDALTWQVNLVKQGYSPKNVASDADYIAFKNEKNSFHWDGIWQSQDLAKTKLDWGVAPLPMIGSQRAAWAGSHNLVIMRQPRPDDKKLQAAKTFIGWVSQHSIEWAKGGQVPARNSVRNSAAFKGLKAQSVFAKEVGYVHYPPAVPGIGDAQAEMEAAVNRAVLGKQSPKQALDQGASKANKLLAENKKKYKS